MQKSQQPFKFNVAAKSFVPKQFKFVHNFRQVGTQTDLTSPKNGMCILNSIIEHFWTANLRHVGIQCSSNSSPKSELKQKENPKFTMKLFPESLQKLATESSTTQHHSKKKPQHLLLSHFMQKPQIKKSDLLKNKPKVEITAESNVLHKGNILDSSKPVLHKGKTRNRPKKPSRLKKIILEERQEKLILGEENSVPNLEQVQLEEIDVSLQPCSSNGQENPENVAVKKIEKSGRKKSRFCNNEITDDLNNNLKSLLSQLIRFQDRQYSKDPLKAKSKRRMVYGLKETLRKVDVGLLKMVIFAPDIENVDKEDGLNQLIQSIIDQSVKQNVPYCFGLGRNRLGRILKKNSPVSCVGILNYQGADIYAKSIIDLTSKKIDQIDTTLEDTPIIQ